MVHGARRRHSGIKVEHLSGERKVSHHAQYCNKRKRHTKCVNTSNRPRVFSSDLRILHSDLVAFSALPAGIEFVLRDRWDEKVETGTEGMGVWASSCLGLLPA